jgi:hypothetical protein
LRQLDDVLTKARRSNIAFFTIGSSVQQMPIHTLVSSKRSRNQPAVRFLPEAPSRCSNAHDAARPQLPGAVAIFERAEGGTVGHIPAFDRVYAVEDGQPVHQAPVALGTDHRRRRWVRLRREQRPIRSSHHLEDNAAWNRSVGLLTEAPLFVIRNCCGSHQRALADTGTT